jgi:hypothetical protein
VPRGAAARVSALGVLGFRRPARRSAADARRSQFGVIVLTTSAGIMDHEEARRKKTGGKVRARGGSHARRGGCARAPPQPAGRVLPACATPATACCSRHALACPPGTRRPGGVKRARSAACTCHHATLPWWHLRCSAPAASGSRSRGWRSSVMAPCADARASFADPGLRLLSEPPQLASGALPRARHARRRAADCSAAANRSSRDAGCTDPAQPRSWVSCIPQPRKQSIRLRSAHRCASGLKRSNRRHFGALLSDPKPSFA